MNARRLLALATLIPISTLLAMLLADVPGGPFLSRGALGLVLLAGLFVIAQCGWLVVVAARSQGTILVVRDGGLAWSRPGAESTTHGRRVLMQVAAGQAVVLERLGRFSRVLGPGTSRLLPGETVIAVVSTEPQTVSGTVDCSSKDGIPVDVQFEARAQLQSKGTDDPGRTPGARSQEDRAIEPREDVDWSPDAVARAAYEGGRWEGGVIGLVRSVLRDVIAHSYLSEIIAGDGPSDASARMASIAERARVRMVAAAREFGVGISAVRITAFTLPHAFAQSAIDVWSPAASATGTAPGNEAPPDPETCGRLILAPLIARSGFSTIRKAVRDAAFPLSASLAEAAGRKVEVRRLADGPAEVPLRPNTTLFAMEVRDNGFVDSGVGTGDLVVVESGDAMTDGRILAVVADGRPSLRRCWLKADHALLTAASARLAPLVVVEHEVHLASIAARYRDEGMTVDVRHSSQVKVLGAVQLLLRPGGGAPSVSRDVSNTHHPSPSTEQQSGVSSAAGVGQDGISSC